MTGARRNGGPAARRRAAGRWRVAPIAVIAVLATLLAACSGVPRSSDPQVVRSIGGEASTPAAPSAPPPGADQSTIVRGFLAENASTDVRHTSARQYLTADAQKRWQDTSATIVNDVLISGPDPLTAIVTATTKIGSVAADGTYTPTLANPASPSAADGVTFTFGLMRVDGQWRIDQLPNGLILTEERFKNSYSQFPVYFFDSAEQQLVPDMRYTATNGQSLATFLLTQLIAGPRGELSALTNEMPDQPATGNPTVTVGPVTDVELVSVNRMPSANLTKLAMQLAFTLSARPADFGGQRTGIKDLRLVEAGAPVVIPGLSDVFGTRDFPDYIASSQVSSDVWFIRNGALYSSAPSPSGTGKKAAGPAGEGQLSLTSASQAHGSRGRLAALGATPAGDQLYIGQDAASLAAVPMATAPRLTRPAWAAPQDEVWISDGTRLLRMAGSGPLSEVLVTARAGSVQGTIVSLRMSRDGCRIAVIYDTGGSRAVWVGMVVRTSAGVRVEQLAQITRAGFGRLDDVAWRDEGTLYVSGLQTTGNVGVWTVQVDGSLLGPSTTSQLPSANGDPRPVTVTAAPLRVAWISVANTLWELAGTATPAMSDPSAPSTGSTEGSAPAYQD